MAIDLHTHSCCSDGTKTPSQLVELAADKNLKVLALTDHDTVAGVMEAQKAAAKAGITLIPGIELSSVWNAPELSKEKDIHILGYNVDISDESFLRTLESFRSLRNERNEKMLCLLNEHGLTVDSQEFNEMYKDSVITRAHYAEYLFKKNYVKSVAEAFEKYLGDGCPCFAPKVGVSCSDAIRAIISAGGQPVLAHPPQYKLTDRLLKKLVEELIECGLEGIEAIYSTYTQDQERTIRAIARRYELHITGGSDYHGDKKPDISLGTGLGHLYVPDETADWLLE